MSDILSLIGDRAGDYVAALIVLALAALAIDALRDMGHDIATMIATLINQERNK